MPQKELPPCPHHLRGTTVGKHSNWYTTCWCQNIEGRLHHEVTQTTIDKECINKKGGRYLYFKEKMKDGADKS